MQDMMTGKQKLYFLLDTIDDVRVMTPAGQPLIIDPTNKLNRKYTGQELSGLFVKLAKDEKVIKLIKAPQRVKDEFDWLDPYDHADDGCWHVELLPTFDRYFSVIQQELEYQEFTGRRPVIFNEHDKIDNWLGKKSEQALRRLWQVVNAIHYEWELRDEDVFPMPLEKFGRSRITNVHDIRILLTNLHRRKIIEVSKKVGEMYEEAGFNDRPQGGSVWVTIIDDQNIALDSGTQIKLFPGKFGYLADKLRALVKGEAPKVLQEVVESGDVWPITARKDGLDFVFDDSNSVIFKSKNNNHKVFDVLFDLKGSRVEVRRLQSVLDEKYVGSEKVGDASRTIDRLIVMMKKTSHDHPQVTVERSLGNAGEGGSAQVWIEWASSGASAK